MGIDLRDHLVFPPSFLGEIGIADELTYIQSLFCRQGYLIGQWSTVYKHGITDPEYLPWNLA